MAYRTSRSAEVLASESVYPQWFSAFLADRAVRKPSQHTAKAYRQDFASIAKLIASDRAEIVQLEPADITKDAMRAAFAVYAETREPATIRRCWSTWNTLCAFLHTSECLQSNPMPLVGRPDPKPLPKGLGAATVAGLLAAIDSDAGSRHRSDRPERDRALVLTGVLAGLRADEIIGANVGTFASLTTAASSMSVAKATRTAEYRWSRAYLESSIAIWTPAQPGFALGRNVRPQSPGWRRGRRPMRYLSAATVSESPGRLAIPGASGLQEGWPQRPARAWRTRARAASHLRHGTRQLQRQRLRTDEAAWSRVNRYITTLR